MQARAAALLADKYGDPWLKISRYEVLTDDLLARLADAEERVAEPEAAIEDYLLWEPGKKGHAAAHERLRAALASADTKEGT